MKRYIIEYLIQVCTIYKFDANTWQKWNIDTLHRKHMNKTNNYKFWSKSNYTITELAIVNIQDHSLIKPLGFHLIYE